MSTSEPTVLASALNYAFSSGGSSKRVLDSVDFEMQPGEIVIVTGPSGSGKTTLLTLVGALRSVQQGEMFVLGKPLHQLDKRSLVDVRREIGFIFQMHNLFDALSAFENVKMSLELRKYSKEYIKKRAIELLTELGLGERIDYKPQALSGGQRQRVAIARALANKPQLILADEPTAALDRESGRTVVNLIQRLAKQEQSSILLVTHDNRILDIADRIVTLVDGRIESDVNLAERLRICEILRQTPAFRSLTPGELTEMAEHMQRETFAKGDAIVRQGEIGDRLFVLQQGVVEVFHDDGDGSRSVASLESGNVFGEGALLTSGERNATVIAQEDVSALSLTKESFDQALNSSVSFNQEILQIHFTRTNVLTGSPHPPQTS
ncbi:putative ABC transporter ATP-binding protein [Planctomycetes bacterium Pan216]|uniref:Putative ABC transporter ATP-binding protein n=1 Tax=Kolteria novifilia TaxID=2527975 RepID=A0A518B097_9BACT|nr:putative ABC transporter ATP-binding protein [Planctomycetes bacterium Pan216]